MHSRLVQSNFLPWRSDTQWNDQQHLVSFCRLWPAFLLRGADWIFTRLITILDIRRWYRAYVCDLRGRRLGPIRKDALLARPRGLVQSRPGYHHNIADHSSSFCPRHNLIYGSNPELLPFRQCFYPDAVPQHDEFVHGSGCLGHTTGQQLPQGLFRIVVLPRGLCLLLQGQIRVTGLGGIHHKQYSIRQHQHSWLLTTLWRSQCYRVGTQETIHHGTMLWYEGRTRSPIEVRQDFCDDLLYHCSVTGGCRRWVA